MIATVPSDCVRVRDVLPGHAYGCNQPCPTSVAPEPSAGIGPRAGDRSRGTRATSKESTPIARSVPPAQVVSRLDRPVPCTA